MPHSNSAIPSKKALEMSKFVAWHLSECGLKLLQKRKHRLSINDLGPTVILKLITDNIEVEDGN
jgi:hypothetical protein